MTEADILKALSNVQEPDLGKDLVSLNMIQDLSINGNKVAFTIVLTTPACPMKDLMKNASENAIKYSLFFYLNLVICYAELHVFFLLCIISCQPSRYSSPD